MINLKKTLSSFKPAFSGLFYVIKNENNFRFHLLATMLVIGFGIYQQITLFDWILLFFTIGFVMSLEILNSAIEKLVDIVSPEHNPRAGLIKDISAASVLVASIAAIIIAVFIFIL
jgi:diacylglycerol kinase